MSDLIWTLDRPLIMAAPRHETRIILICRKEVRGVIQSLDDKFKDAFDDGYDGWRISATADTEDTTYTFYLFGADAADLLARARPLIDGGLREGGRAKMRGTPTADGKKAAWVITEL